MDQWQLIVEAGRSTGIAAVAVVALILKGWLVPGRYYREEREEKKAWRSIALSASMSSEKSATVAAALAKAAVPSE